ncbi:MAG TPA: DUF5915 domain-containing protein, partial [Streptosporangiaceae bacterium]|nr:DUF5915 domain-containing protein [Streptosporangiaceae bacterium]
ADPDSVSALPGSIGLVALDTVVTPELAAEGIARDVVRIVQQARRDAGLAVSDRIRLTIGADGTVADAVRAHAEFLAGETLAVDVTIRPTAEVSAPAQGVGDGGSVRVMVAATAPAAASAVAPAGSAPTATG